MKADPVDLLDVAAGEGALSILETAVANALDLALRQHLSIVCPQHRQ
jgi:hypothetical protein